MADDKKAPGIFRKPVTKIRWEKKFLKKIYLPEDRKFLESLAVEEDGMIRVNTAGISAKNLKRLKEIGKAIKSNRKSVSFILIFILVLLAGGGALFHFYVKDRLAGRLIEKGLEKVFLAKAETAGVKISILGGSLSLDYLAIADAEDPMTNLVEFSSVEADLNTAELLQGRIRIEDLGFSGMKRGTARTVSGALDNPSAEGSGEDSAGTGSSGKDPGAAQAGDGSTLSNSVSDIVNRLSVLAGSIDPQQILESQKENLQSFGVIEDAQNKIEEYSSHWQERAEDWSGKMDEWQDSAKYVASINPSSFTDAASAQAAITRLQKIYSSAETDFNAVQSDFTAAGKQLDAAVKLSGDVTRAVEADYRYIEALVVPPKEGTVDWAAGILEQVLSMPVRKYLSYLDRGMQWYERIERLTETGEKIRPGNRKAGRSLPQPGGAPSGFVLVHASASGEEPGTAYGFELNNIVSEPDKKEGEASLEIALETASLGAASALITESGMNLEIPSVSFDLGNTLEALDIADFSGRLSIAADAEWHESLIDGDISIHSGEMLLSPAVQGSIIFKLINSVIESAGGLSADGSFSWSDPGKLSMSLQTSLDKGLSGAVRKLAEEGAGEGLKLLKDYLGSDLEGPLANLEGVLGGLKTDVDSIDSYKSQLEGYRKAAEEKIAAVQKQVEQGLKQQAASVIKDALPAGTEKQIEDAGDALKKNLGGLLNF